MWRLCVGIVVATFGVIGMKVWWNSVLIVLKGTVPITLILFGVVSSVLGFVISSIKDK